MALSRSHLARRGVALAWLLPAVVAFTLAGPHSGSRFWFFASPHSFVLWPLLWLSQSLRGPVKRFSGLPEIDFTKKKRRSGPGTYPIR